MELRQAFVAGAHAVGSLLDVPEIEVRWDQASALAGFTTRGLAGHLVRAVTATVDILERPEPVGDPVDAAAFFADATAGWAEQGDAIIGRGEDQAAQGREALIGEYREHLHRLEGVVLAAGPERLVLRHNRVLALDDFLVVRAVELLVHADDLAVTLGVARPEFDGVLVERVIELLVGTASKRHGPFALIIAMTRRERDAANALRLV